MLKNVFNNKDRERRNEAKSQSTGGTLDEVGSGMFRQEFAAPFLPLISHGSQHPQFSYRVQFPSLIHTMPSSTHQPWVLDKLLSHFNWTWVGLVSSDNGDFEWLEQQLQLEMGHTGGCFSRKIRSQGNSIIMATVITFSSDARLVIYAVTTINSGSWLKFFGRTM